MHAQYLDAGHLHPAHFCYPITDGSAAGILPMLGCRHTCGFCNLGVPPFRQAPIDLLKVYIDRLEQQEVRKIIISAPTFTQYRHQRERLEHIRAYAQRPAAKGEKVTTIIGSIRADELTMEAELAKGPAAHGWEDQRWSLNRIKAMIGRRLHLTYTVQQVCKLLVRS
ncbi:hypothetical protein GCM10010524_34160 [Streptomyces mexicanus]